MNYLLAKCAELTTGSKDRIDFPTVRGAVTHANVELKLLCWGVADMMDRVLRRQAALRALDDGGRGADVLAHFANGGPGFLASLGTPIRSSHSGAPVDLKLPQGPYDAAPPGATAGIRGRANWAWLEASTTRHTTHHPPVNVNRVASYFELEVPTITDDKGTVQLSGGRVVYDPFAHRFFVSEHYKDEFEFVNVPAVNADQAYQDISQEITTHAAAVAAGGAQWPTLYDDLARRMGSGEL
ncbi:hypothetical protein [Yinghuangia sp. YIM S10712]|uniref:hypothetical protein n=1 Tax=Yinghuangia sp. YIM S10712 TaxID=3436930 RepID=UPI003F52FFC2